MTARPTFKNVQQEFYRGMSQRLFTSSDFTDPLTSKVTSGLRAVTAGAGAIIAGTISTNANHPGIWRMLTGTTAIGRVFILSIAGGTLVGTLKLGGGLTRIGTWMKTGAILSNSLERYTLRSGLVTVSLPNVVEQGVFFEYDDSQNGGRWQAICGDAPGVETVADTGNVVTASTWYKLEIEINAAGTSVDFIIDDVLVATVAANIPSGPAFVLFYNTHIMKLIGTLSREMEIDAMYIYQELSR